MFKKALILLGTLVVIPYLAFTLGKPLSAEQFALIKTLVYTCLGFALGSFIVSEISKNYSQTDKLWSITPVVYVWITAAYTDWNIRVVFLAILVTIWGARLTYNFNRRGGYSLKFWEGEEDYRWAILQQRKPFNKKWVFSLFNLLFISLYQHYLILFITLPIVLSIHTTEIFWYDYILGGLLVIFVVIETIADKQQWTFQNEKHRRIQQNEELGSNYGKGFVHKGLWGIVRHPNYAAEQAIWIVFYLFSISATHIWINWSIMGCILLVILFKNSSDFSEEISSGKYPDYKAYQKKVGRFLPNFTA